MKQNKTPKSWMQFDFIKVANFLILRAPSAFSKGARAF
jgi:hypothetical protein